MRASDRKRTRMDVLRPAFRALGLSIGRVKDLAPGTERAGRFYVAWAYSRTFDSGSPKLYFHRATEALAWTEANPPGSEAVRALLGQAPAKPEAPKATPAPSEAPAPKAPEAPKATPAPAGSLDAMVDARIRAVVEAGGANSPVDEAAVRAIVEEMGGPGLVRRVVEVKTPAETKVVEGQHKRFADLLGELAIGHHCFLAGPAGSGKTTALFKAAEALGMAVYFQGPVNTPWEILGYRDASGAYQDTPAYRWATHDGPALLILDEVDASHPSATIALNALLANGEAAFPHEHVTVGKDKLAAVTANTWGLGANAEYCGRTKLDAAFLDRIQGILDWDYDTDLETRIAVEVHGGKPEWVAESLGIRAKLQEKGIRLVWSPRQTFAYCARRAHGLTKTEALDRSALARLDAGQRKGVTS